ncbi:MAG: hypothetical protein OEZ06_23590 [Myxococcales bacterium]|nr:hypothetical protein [Myxococcales bacterium]
MLVAIMQKRGSAGRSARLVATTAMLLAAGPGCHRSHPSLEAPVPIAAQPEPVETATEQPAAPVIEPDPGGQSGSDSSGVTFCGDDTVVQLDPDAPTPYGPSTHDILASISDLTPSHGAAALYWRLDGWDASGVDIFLSVSGKPMLRENSSCGGSSVHQGAEFTLTSTDGHLDHVFSGELSILGTEAGFILYFDGATSLEPPLDGPLAQAFSSEEGMLTPPTPAAEPNFLLSATFGAGVLSGELIVLRSVEVDGEGITERLPLATFTTDEPARRPIVAPAQLQPACQDRVTDTLPLEPPHLDYAERLAALAGTWILCAGNHPESLMIDHHGLTLNDAGNYQTLLLQGEQLVAQHGFGNEGTLTILDAEMCNASGDSCLTVRSMRADSLLYPSDTGVVHASATSFKLSADRGSMSWRAADEDGAWIDLHYTRTSLPVQAAETSSYATGERLGADGCGALESDLRHTTSSEDLLATLIGRWTWCAGAPSPDHATLEFDASGRYQALSAAGTELQAGQFAVVPGNPASAYYVAMLPDAGAGPWELTEQQLADRPLKLLVHVSRFDSHHTAILSALP